VESFNNNLTGVEQNLHNITEAIMKLVSTGSFIVENKGISDGTTVDYTTNNVPKGSVLILHIDTNKALYLYDDTYVRNGDKVTLNSPITNGNGIYFVYVV